MLYKKIFSDNYLSKKQIISIGFVIGLVAAILFGSIFSFIQYKKRDASYTDISQDMGSYLTTLFSQLQATAKDMQPLLAANCTSSSRELTSRAAFNLNVRTFVLVRDGIAFCSSATGEMSMPLKEIAPSLDAHKNVDLEITSSTPRIQNHPMIAAWFRSPGTMDNGIFAAISINLKPYLLFSAQQRNITSIALVVGDNALTSNNEQVVGTDKLSTNPTRITQIQGYPIKLYLFGSPWRAEDIQLSVLSSLIFGLLVGSLGAYILTVHRRPEHEVLTGIKLDQFFLAYQPVMAIPGLEVRGVEILMRWRHPSAGLIPPDIFINVAETQHIIIPLTQHLFKLVAQDAVLLQKVLPAGSKLAFNLSPSHLYSPAFKNDIQALVAALPQDHFHVVFEITERGMLKEAEATEIFAWLHDQGFDIAVDDFGTGNSALIYLERFNLDFLKIDKGFINSIGVNTTTTPVLDTILALARRLNLETVAEGVETPEQANWLINHGVNYLQGYYFAPPLPSEAFVEWYLSPRNYDEIIHPS